MKRYTEIPDGFSSEQGQELQKIYKKELSKLKRQHKDLDKKTQAVIESTLQDIARQTAMMAVLWKGILENGTEAEYKNGENQYGKKQSTSFQSYQQCSQKHTAAMKVLQGFIPKEKPEPKDDGFNGFVNAGDD